MERHDELDEAPILRSIAKEDPFVAPQGFFNTFPQAVQQHIQASTTTEREGLLARWSNTLWPRITIGSLAGIAVAAIVWSVWPATDTTPTELALAEPEELLESDVDEDLLYATLYTENDLMAAVALPEDDTEVLAYLENEDLPLDLLIEDL